MAESAPERIVLVGFMGCGKSTVGPIVAHRLGWSFVDMDDHIERTLGLPVAAIFRERGEPAFRAAELALARELHGTGRAVIAAGGGAFVHPQTREALRVRSITVWLACDFETLAARVEPDGSRPLGADREIMRRLFAEREHAYGSADLTVDAMGAPEEVAERIITAALRSGEAAEQ